jgi:hypothetical protein
MTYSSGGLIQASDYNGLVGPATGASSGQLNYPWSTGSGSVGYGQTAVSQSASSTGTVTATQWSSLINTLNNLYLHQTGSSSGISAVTTGSTIAYLSSLSSSLTTTASSSTSYTSQGSTTTGTVFSPNFSVASTQSAETWTFTRTITFGSGGDAARYFFNAGGQLNFVTTSASDASGTSRGSDLVTLISTNLGSISAIRQGSNSGRSGSGGTLNTNATTLGYYGLTTSDQTLVQITSTTSPYTSDYVKVAIRSNGTQGSYSDHGSVIYLDFTVYSNTRTALPTPSWGGVGTAPTVNTSVNDALNTTWNHRIDVVYPETTYLSNTWGTVTIS